jgi:hypothetical protein
MTQLRTSATPHIPTCTTSQLLLELQLIDRRDPADSHLIEDIRHGHDDALATFVGRAQHGDPVAATLALGALLPRLCAVVIHRLPILMWKPAIDEYISLTFLVMLDVDLDAGSEHLIDKVLARTRRRYERNTFGRRPAPTRDNDLIELGPVADDVATRALDHLELLEVAQAVTSGRITPRHWAGIVAISLAPRTNPATDSDRRAAARGRRALGYLRETDRAA